MRLLTILGLLFAGPTCARGDVIEEMFRKLEVKNWPMPVSRDSRTGYEPESKHKIEEIGIERTGCYGSCPVYSVIIKSDGSFTYHGIRYIEKVGYFKGQIFRGYVDDLCRFIEESGYMKLDQIYHRPVTDMETVYTTVVMDGKRQIVKDYGDAGPAKLWVLENLIDHLVMNSEMKPVETPKTQPPGKSSQSRSNRKSKP